jgi:hypothetical protein
VTVTAASAEVVLASEPSGNVTVTATSGQRCCDGDAGQSDVHVDELGHGSDGDGDREFDVHHRQLGDVSYTAASTDAAYNGLAGDVVTVTVTDNDDHGPDGDGDRRAGQQRGR